MFGSLDYFLYLCRVIRSGSDHENNPSNSPFKTLVIMNKTVRTILQVLSYLIAAILGAAGEATLM